MKKILTILGLIGLASLASAQLVTTMISQTDLAEDMVADTLFVSDVLLADKSDPFGDFNFDGLSFTFLNVSELTINVGDVVTVDYLGRNAADHNDLMGQYGVNDVNFFDYYGVLSGLQSVQIETTSTQELVFWNADVSQNIDGYWGDPDHFKTFYASTQTTDYYLMFVDDRGDSQPWLQDWNDGVFLVSHDMSDLAVPEPSAIGFLASFVILGLAITKRRR